MPPDVIRCGMFRVLPRPIHERFDALSELFSEHGSER
jgi:hypothetical protein